MGAIAYELAARIGKVRGLEGKVTVRGTGGLPLRLYEGLVCHVVPPTLYGPRQVTVSSLKELGDGTVVASFAEAPTVDAVQDLTGRYLLAEADDLDSCDGASADDWLGRAVVDEKFGELGRIEEFIVTPANDVWVVRGARGEVLVPAVEEFVVDVPEDASSPIRTAIPDGLVG